MNGFSFPLSKLLGAGFLTLATEKVQRHLIAPSTEGEGAILCRYTGDRIRLLPSLQEKTGVAGRGILNIGFRSNLVSALTINVLHDLG